MGRPAIWIILVCAECREAFFTKPCKARAGQRFCSAACRSRALPPPVQTGNQHASKGEAAGRMAMYYRARQLTADVRACQRCGAAAQVTHHADENPRNNAPANLERLCRRCHLAHHRAQLREAKRRAWDPHRHGTPRERRQANGLLGQAVRTGRVLKPRHCTRCGAGGRIDGHHRDYHRPLDVEWLCRPCHGEAHRRPPAGD